MSQPTKKGNVFFAIFLILLILISAGLTYFFIYNHNSASNIEELPPDDNYLTFKEVSLSSSIDVFKEYPINPIEITYTDKIKISGLKDKSVQNRINIKLEELEPFISNDKPTCTITFNVSNILSLSCKNKSLTFNLTNGEEISLEEIFNQNTDLPTITLNTLYDNYCLNKGNCTSDNYEVVEDGNPIENDISNFYKAILNHDYELILYPTHVNLVLKNYDYLEEEYFDYYNTFDFGNYYSDITIYDRYLTEKSIYENEITDYCNPEICNENQNENSLNYFKGEYISNHNFLKVNLLDNTKHDIEFQNTYPDSTIDLNTISPKIINELIFKNNLKRESNNYQYITANFEIYSTNHNYKLISYTLSEKELTKDNFIKYSLGNVPYQTLNTKNTAKINMILTANNNIAYLEDNPNEVFTDFKATLNNYIKENMTLDTNSPFSSYLMVCGYETDSKACLENPDYDTLIEDASYAIDTENKEIHMYYTKEFPTNQIYIITSLPYDIFTLK